MTRRLWKRWRTGWRPGGLHRLPTAAGPVRYRVVRADSSDGGLAPALIVGLHGFGSDERQVATMLALDLPGPLIYLAPRASYREGTGYSWFNVSLVSGEPEPVPASLGAALRRVAAFSDAAAHAWGADRLCTVLVGYSQGGTLALAASQHEAPALETRPYAAIATVSGGVGTLAPPRVPLFLGVGTLDPLHDAGALAQRVATWPKSDVMLSEAAAPHVVTARHRADLSAWLQPRLADRPRTRTPRQHEASGAAVCVPTRR